MCHTFPSTLLPCGMTPAVIGIGIGGTPCAWEWTGCASDPIDSAEVLHSPRTDPAAQVGNGAVDQNEVKTAAALDRTTKFLYNPARQAKGAATHPTLHTIGAIAFGQRPRVEHRRQRQRRFTAGL